MSISPTSTTDFIASSHECSLPVDKKCEPGLPTLDDSSIVVFEDVDSSVEDTNDSTSSCSFQRRNVALDRLIVNDSVPRQLKSNRKFTHKKISNRERVQEMQAEASRLAQSGEEEEALIVYKKALHITGVEVTRVKKQLQRLGGLQPNALKSTHKQLHEDWVQVGVSIAQIRILMALLYEHLGDQDRAIISCKKAQEVYQRQVMFIEKDDSDGLRKIEKLLEQMECMCKQLKLAQASSEDLTSRHEKVAAVRKKVAYTKDIEEKRDLSKKMQKMVKSLRQREVHIFGKRHPKIIELDSLSSVTALEQGDSEIALEHAMRALRISKTSLGMKHPRTGRVLLLMARIYASHPHDFSNAEEDALDCYKKAAVVFGASKKHPLLVGTTLKEISLLHIRRREYKLAVELLTTVLETYKPLSIKEKNEEINLEEIKTWRAVGECNLHMKDYNSAANAFSSALRIQCNTRKSLRGTTLKAATHTYSQDKEDVLCDESIADTLTWLGKAHSSLRNHNRALTAYNEALLRHVAGIQVNGVAGDNSAIHLAKKDQLAHCLYCIAQLHYSGANFDEAICTYGESLQLRLFNDAHRAGQKSNMIHCAMCLSAIGNIHLKRQEVEEAKKAQKDALAYCKQHGKIEYDFVC